ncbi:MAG: hypothetical protein ACOY9J_01270 [Pseudomonadota bacterium]
MAVTPMAGDFQLCIINGLYPYGRHACAERMAKISGPALDEMDNMPPAKPAGSGRAMMVAKGPTPHQ